MASSPLWRGFGGRRRLLCLIEVVSCRVTKLLVAPVSATSDSTINWAPSRRSAHARDEVAAVIGSWMSSVLEQQLVARSDPRNRASDGEIGQATWAIAGRGCTRSIFQASMRRAASLAALTLRAFCGIVIESGSSAVGSADGRASVSIGEEPRVGAVSSRSRPQRQAPHPDARSVSTEAKCSDH